MGRVQTLGTRVEGGENKEGKGTEKMERRTTQDKRPDLVGLPAGPACFLLNNFTQLPWRKNDYHAGGKTGPDFCLLKLQMK